jgi:hypothetical protein
MYQSSWNLVCVSCRMNPSQRWNSQIPSISNTNTGTSKIIALITLIIMGSGLDDWTCWRFFTITTNYSSSQSMTVWDSLHSSLDYERLLFNCDWLGSDLRVGHLRNTKYEWTQLDSLTAASPWIHEWTLFYNSARTEERPPPRTIRLLYSLFVCCYETCVSFVANVRCGGHVPSDSLPSTGGPSTVDCVTLGTCLPNRCLAMVIFVIVYTQFVVKGIRRLVIPTTSGFILFYKAVERKLDSKTVATGS